MKKNFKYLILLILCFAFIPSFTVKAKEGISDYYIDATILENGNIKVIESFTLEGSFNGFERIINYRNSSAPTFDSNNSEFGGSSLYNGTSIIIDKVGSSRSNGDPKTLDVETFKKANFANKGDNGVYTNSSRYDGVSLLIYNPSSYGHNVFYVEYTLVNMGVIHNDISEIFWTLFSDQLTEDIDNLSMTVHIPNNKEELKVWGHGPLNGTVDIINKTTVLYEVKNLNAGSAIDIRLAFDKEVLKESSKFSDVVALDKIINFEVRLADETNREREEARVYYFGTLIACAVWFLGLVVIVVYIYNKYDKEYRSQFSGKYFRDFPTTYGPEIVGYLIAKKIDTKELSSAILNLIADKHVTMETIGEKEAKLTRVSEYAKLKESDQLLASWLFNNIGDGKTVTLSQIKHAGKDYEEFFKYYSLWQKSALSEAKSYNFFETNAGPKTLTALYSLLGIGIGFFAYQTTLNAFLFIVMLIISIVATIYFLTFTKRTKTGNEDFVKWNGLKNFIKDFGNFKDRDLPDMILWEKYLVYAHVFGLSEKLAKTMQIKVVEMQQTGMYDTNLGTTLIHLHMFTAMNRTINSSVSSAVSTAVSTRTAAMSRNSDGFGGGGGFSGGGGGFGGGGGGGGRF